MPTARRLRLRLALSRRTAAHRLFVVLPVVPAELSEAGSDASPIGPAPRPVLTLV